MDNLEVVQASAPSRDFGIVSVGNSHRSYRKRNWFNNIAQAIAASNILFGVFVYACSRLGDLDIECR
jgi:hypothetical protein